MMKVKLQVKLIREETTRILAKRRGVEGENEIIPISLKTIPYMFLLGQLFLN